MQIRLEDPKLSAVNEGSGNISRRIMVLENTQNQKVAKFQDQARSPPMHREIQMSHALNKNRWHPGWHTLTLEQKW